MSLLITDVLLNPAPNLLLCSSGLVCIYLNPITNMWAVSADFFSTVCAMKAVSCLHLVKEEEMREGSDEQESKQRLRKRSRDDAAGKEGADKRDAGV